MGLWLAWVLSSRGLAVALIDAQNDLGNGSSIRNEGWLHRGTYYAATIVDRAAAMQVAQRTILGHDATLRLAPESLEELDSKTFVLLRSECLDEITSRWDEAGVFYRYLCKADFQALEPELDVGNYDCVCEVADVAINNRIVYSKLASQARANAVSIFYWHEGAQLL